MSAIAVTIFHRPVDRPATQRARGAAPGAGPGGLESLESRLLFAIVQPAGQDYLLFEAEDPQATITDLDGDGITWKRVNGSSVNAATSAPVGGAIRSFRDAAVTDNNEGQISYPVQLTSAGPYFVYARTFYRNIDGDNSMYLPANGGPIDAQPTQQWDNNNVNGEYHWNLTDNTSTAFSFTNPTPGAVTNFKMNIREHLYTVDRVVLSTREMTEDELNALTPQTVRLTPALYPDVNGVAMTFDAVTGATGYDVLRGTSAAGPFTAVTGGTGLTDTSFVDDSLPAGDLIYLKLVGRLARLGRRATVEEVEEFFAPYAPYRGLAAVWSLTAVH